MEFLSQQMLPEKKLTFNPIPAGGGTPSCSFFLHKSKTIGLTEAIEIFDFS